MNDEGLNCIHGSMSSEREMMAAKMKHVQVAEVSSLSTIT